MNIFTILGITAGAAVALVLHVLFIRKIERRGPRIGMFILGCLLFTLFGFLFSSLYSLSYTLDRFFENRIGDMERVLARRFPGSDIFELSFSTTELTALNDGLQESINEINTGRDSFFERMVFNAFLLEIRNYTNAVNTGALVLSDLSNDDGTISVRTLLIGIKDLSIAAIAPYVTVFRVLLVIAFLIILGIFIGVAVYFKKQGSFYNKSIVYGESGS